MMKPEKADTIAQYALFSAQFAGWNGSGVKALRTMDLYPNDPEAPEGWHKVLSDAQAWINEHIHFSVVVNGQVKILRPALITGIPDAKNAPKEFRKDNKLPIGCIDAEVRGVDSAVDLVESEFNYPVRVPATGKTLDQELFEAILKCNKDWGAWYAWGMFLKIIDTAPVLDRGTKDRPVTVTPEWVKYWACRTGGRRIKRTITSNAGKALFAVVERYRKSLPRPGDDWDKS